MDSAAVLAIKRLAGVALKMSLIIPLHMSCEEHKWGVILLLYNPVQISTEVQEGVLLAP